MKVYTRRGDGGETDLFGGSRVAKDDLRVEAYGAVDELNAALGVCRGRTAQPELARITERLQGLLFELGATLATRDDHREKSGMPAPRAEVVEEMEREIDSLQRELPELRRFILPGGCEAAAAFHVARTVCRRAERCVVALHREEPLEETVLRTLNRLSDLLFVMARVENHRAGVGDVEWKGGKT